MDIREAFPLPTYDERYCAFVDILGFSELIGRLSHNDTPFEALRTLLRLIHEHPADEYEVLFAGSDFRAQSISDAVCLSARQNGAGILNLLFVLERLTHNMLHHGFFIRGAVVKGRLYHDDKMVFGEALLRAYRLESEIVRFPRIMLESSVVSDINEFVVSSNYGFELSGLISEADDGPRFLHVLSNLKFDLKEKSRVERLRSYQEMAHQIQRRFDESRDNPKHFEKVQWFARYWNRFVVGTAVPSIMRTAADGAGSVVV
jgi:hypothetical protein